MSMMVRGLLGEAPWLQDNNQSEESRSSHIDQETILTKE